jgi:hypothetical protein
MANTFQRAGADDGDRTLMLGRNASYLWLPGAWLKGWCRAPEGRWSFNLAGAGFTKLFQFSATVFPSSLTFGQFLFSTFGLFGQCLVPSLLGAIVPCFAQYGLQAVATVTELVAMQLTLILV